MLRAAVLGVVLTGSAACDAFDSVDLGDNPAVRTANLDEDFFVCRLQPEVLSARGCATGEAGEACHATESSYRLLDVDAGYASGCEDGFLSNPPDTVLTNFEATQPWMFEDPESSPLLTR